MTSQDYYTMKGMIASLPKEQQDEINVAYTRLKNIIDLGGELALMEFTLLAIEQQDKANAAS